MPGHGALDTVWGEDGVVFYDGTLRNGPLSLILQPYNGYLHVVPRLVMEVVRCFPLSAAAAVMATLGALMTSCCAFLVYFASSGHLRSRALRLAITVPAALPYVGQLEVGNNVLSIHCVLLYVAFWMCLWNPDSRPRQILAATVLFLTVASDPLTAVYIPLLILRLWAVRSWRGRLPAIAMAASLALQGYGILFRHALQSRKGAVLVRVPRWGDSQGFGMRVAGSGSYLRR
jgi:hypothetical protein